MLNNITLMGRLTANPELRYTHTNNIPVAGFSVAVNRRYVKDKEQITDFFNIVAWQGTADFVTKNFTKGQPICIQGRLQQRSWDDEAGKKHYAVEVVAESVYFAGYKKEEGQNGAADFDPFEEEAKAAA